MAAILCFALAACGRDDAASDASAYEARNLLEAVLMGDPHDVARFIAKGADVNAQEADGTTPLMRAVHGKQPEVVQLLIDAGANVAAANRYGVTALYLAARGADAASARELLAAGANPNTALPDGETVLMTAAKVGDAQIVRALLTGGNDEPVTPHPESATWSDSGAAVREEGPVRRADPNAKEGWYGQTALMWAAAAGNVDVIQLLIEAGANVNERSRLTDLPETNYPDQGDFVSPPVPKGRLTALHFAAREGSAEAATTLIANGAELDAVDADGTTPLVLAALNGHLDLAALLLEAGADPNVADAYGRTVLFVATDLNTPSANPRIAPPLTGTHTPVDIVSLALAKGAKPDAALTKSLPGFAGRAFDRDPILNAGATPLLRAAMSNDVTIMKLLLDAGANPLVATAPREPVSLRGEVRPSSGETTALMAAAGLGWREPVARGRESDALASLDLLLARGADVNAANQAGDTALHGAALRGSTTVIQYLVDHGANVNAKNARGWTPLDIAVGQPAERIPYNEATANLLRKLSRRS